MENIIQEILKWPIIVQGALGSGLFWLLLSLGQRMQAFFVSVASNYSNEIKLQNLKILRDKYIGVRAHFNNDIALVTSITSGLSYQCIRCICKGLVWVCLGLIFYDFIYVLGIVGFVGATYYFIIALNRVQSVDIKIDVNEKLKEIEKNITDLLNKKTIERT